MQHRSTSAHSNPKDSKDHNDPTWLYQSWKEALSQVERPCALVDLDALEANAQWVLSQANQKPIRVASKSVRCVSVLKRLRAMDSRFSTILGFIPREIPLLLQHGFRDIVVAYPTMSEEAVTRAVRAANECEAMVVFMVDHSVQLELLERVGAKLDCKVRVCIDLDVSLVLPALRFGVFRSPIRHTEQVLGLLSSIEKQKHLQLDGLMTYEAQLAGVPDAGSKPLQRVIRRLKALSKPRIKKVRRESIEVLRSRVDLRFVNAGGTGCLDFSSSDSVVTEATAGSAFFAPTLFDGYLDFQLRPAAAFALDVVRKPEMNMVTCFGGGYVASGEPGWNRVPSPYLPEGLALIPFEGTGEVQTPLRGEAVSKLSFGDPVFFRHAKAGELSEHFNQLHLLSKGSIVESASTYRGDGLG